jgi:hypothetical protein
MTNATETTMPRQPLTLSEEKTLRDGLCAIILDAARDAFWLADSDPDKAAMIIASRHAEALLAVLPVPQGWEEPSFAGG